MRYGKVEKAVFLRRPNRFIAEVLLNGEEITVHVKNTGRCRELLVTGAIVYLEKSDNPERKTQYDLIAVEKGDILINMDSQIPNGVCLEWLKRSGLFSKTASLLLYSLIALAKGQFCRFRRSANILRRHSAHLLLFRYNNRLLPT